MNNARRASDELAVGRNDSIDDLVVDVGRVLGMRLWDAMPALSTRVVRAVLAGGDGVLPTLGPAWISVDEIIFALKFSSPSRMSCAHSSSSVRRSQNSE